MTTTNDWLNDIETHLLASDKEQMDRLQQSMNAITTSLSFSFGTISPGDYVSIGLETMYVWTTNATAQTAEVERAMLGTTAATHTAGDIIYVNARFPRHAMLNALNAELHDLSAIGLEQMKSFELTASASRVSYEIPSINSDLLTIYDIRWDSVGPYREWPQLHSWRIDRNADTTQFPSGVSLRLDEIVTTGRTIKVQYRAPLGALSTLTDNVATVTGLLPNELDIPPLGAAYRLLTVREAKRTFTETQGSSRDPQEVPVGSIARAAAVSFKAQRDERVASAKKDRSRMWPT